MKKLDSSTYLFLALLSMPVSASVESEVASVIKDIAIAKGIEITLGVGAVNPVTVLAASLTPREIGGCPAIEDPSSEAYKSLQTLRGQNGFSADNIQTVLNAIPGC